MRYRSAGSDRGAVTAELAMGIPALLGVVAITLGAMRWGTDSATATTLASQSSFAIERGQPVESVMTSVRARMPHATWSSSGDCVRAELPAPLPLAMPIMIEQCATM